MNDIEQKALKLLNEVQREHGSPCDLKMDRDFIKNEALCRAIEQHEAFRQEVSDAVTALLGRFLGDSLSQGVINGHLHQFIIPAPKPDPLVEAIDAWFNEFRQEVSDAASFRTALEAYGLEIRTKANAHSKTD